MSTPPPTPPRPGFDVDEAAGQSDEAAAQSDERWEYQDHHGALDPETPLETDNLEIRPHVESHERSDGPEHHGADMGEGGGARSVATGKEVHVGPNIAPGAGKPDAKTGVAALQESLATAGEAAVLNVSHSVDKTLYDIRVPYIAGLSNGVELPDPVILDFKPGHQLPPWLRGALYRNGPGIFDIEYLDKRDRLKIFSFEHWFDALALVHRFEIDGEAGTVQYRSRFTSTTLEQLVRKSVRNSNGKLNETDLHRLGVKKMDSDPSACSTINPDFPLGRVRGADHLVLTDRSSLLQEIDPITLIPKRVFRYSNINPEFTGDMAGALPYHDQIMKGIINYTMQTSLALVGGASATYKFFSILNEDPFDPPGHLITTIQGQPTKAYTFAVTKTYIVLMVFPYTTATQLLFNKNPDASMKFDPTGTTTFHVIHRERREEVCKYQSGSFFAMHVINAYDGEDGSVCIDVNAYDTDEIIRCFELENLRTTEMPPLPQASVRRYILAKIPEAAAMYKVRKTNLPEAFFTHRSDFALEFPSINKRFTSIHHRYAWGISVSPESRVLTNSIWDSIVKADLKEKLRKEWKQPGCFPSEPIMVPEPLNMSTPGELPAEDAGVLLSVVLDANKNTSFLLVLDAENMHELGRVDVTFAIPFGFHGAWTSHITG
ncbi:hypothetical protein HK104_003870 [Borealophlyctis nickersoniae]|nr:hypothetical protein HK104_003870 [Borealophlyctis nickersoniae]